MAELVIGPLETEVVRHAGLWPGLDDIEYATLEWTAWFNTCRLLESLGYLSQRSMKRSFRNSRP